MRYRKWIILFTICAVSSLLVRFLTTLSLTSKTSSSSSSKLVKTAPESARLAYLITGAPGQGKMLQRTLLAVYHPLNQYVVHLDMESSAEERLILETFIDGYPCFEEFKNVRMIFKGNWVTSVGPTLLATVLHAAALLLKEGGDWDWFIHLTASHYPLVSQDDLLYTFSYLPRDLNFIEHTSNMSWDKFQRTKSIVIDRGLYRTWKTEMFSVVSLQRPVPTAFKLFTGSAWMILSRQFIEYCIWGWDNLPRTALMYYANGFSSAEGYFHTVICNSQEFQNTTVNSDLHYISWGNPPKQHPRYLNVSDMSMMVESNAAFAWKFSPNDMSVLDKIDYELLSRSPGMVVPGGWCTGSSANGSDPCLVSGNIAVLKPTTSSLRLIKLITSLVSAENFQPKQCK
ncbi:hypothetical protein RND81_03G141300 [Saponaria officinalis]|uniref:Uncharacterized protein n=1 Tax=Saponaria officinalis TaxID=3572 RepID=A0AAW1M6L5_SAPOF